MNNITINNYIETILNPSGKFKTLKIKAKKDSENTPILYTKSGMVTFEVSIENVDYRIKCFTNTNIISYSRAKLIAQHTQIKQYKYLTTYQYLYREMLVFNSAGEYNYVDIILEKIPKGESLGVTVHKAIGANDYNSAEIIFKNIVEMFNWLAEFGITHNNINPQNIIIDDNLNPILINYDLAVKNRSNYDCQAMASLGITYFTLMCNGEEFASLENLNRNYKNISRKIVKTIASATLESELDQLKELANSIIDSNSNIQSWTYVHTILNNISNKIKRYKTLKDAFNSNDISDIEPKVNIKNQYNFIGALSDNMIRVEKDNKWQFIDYNGDLVINNSFDMAYDFIESRAAVSIGDKWGLIDQKGEFVIPPIYDDLTWDGDSNVSIVSNNGLMGLINRMGEIVAPFIYDSIYTGSEGYMLAQTDYSYGFLKPDGNIAIEFKYDTASSFRNGVAAVEIKGEHLFIDISGEII